MQLVRFIQVGNELNTTIHLLRDKLNAIQDQFYFIFEDDIIDLKSSKENQTMEFSIAILENELNHYLTDHNYIEYAISITNLKLTDEFFYTSTERVACISIVDWPSFTSISIIKGLEFITAAILIDRKIDTDIHEKPLGCPNDLCDDKKEIDIELNKCDYCPSCKRTIYLAIEKGRISLTEVTAIYRIFDDVAERKYGFVIMPFKPELQNVYITINKALTSENYICRRADEISRSGSIVGIVLEQIGRSSLIVADLTDANPNVFYELGYAHALGKNTILIVQEGHSVPFDTRHIQYLKYNINDLENTLIKGLKQYLV